MGSQSALITAQLGEYNLLGLSFGYNFASAHKVLSMLSNTALQSYYRLLLIWDNLFPFIYGSMYVCWLSFIYKKQTFSKAFLRYINLYPLLPVLVDLTENYFERQLITQYLNTSNLQYHTVKIASIITQLKWMCSSFNYLLILLGLFLIFKQWLYSKYRK